MGLKDDLIKRFKSGAFWKRLFTGQFWYRAYMMAFVWELTASTKGELMSADCILGQAAGWHKDRSPGPANHYIARRAKNLQRQFKRYWRRSVDGHWKFRDCMEIPAMLQYESQEAARELPDEIQICFFGQDKIKAQRMEDDHQKSLPGMDDSYIDSVEVAKIQFEECQEMGYKRPIIVTFCHAHMVRVYLACIDAGFKEEDIRIAPIRDHFDPYSDQWWCRSRMNFFIHEILGRAVLLLLGRI